MKGMVERKRWESELEDEGGGIDARPSGGGMEPSEQEATGINERWWLGPRRSPRPTFTSPTNSKLARLQKKLGRRR
jgi:hypothetical protein